MSGADVRGKEMWNVPHPTVFQLAYSLCVLGLVCLILPERAMLGHTNGPTLKRARWRRVGRVSLRPSWRVGCGAELNGLPGSSTNPAQIPPSRRRASKLSVLVSRWRHIFVTPWTRPNSVPLYATPWKGKKTMDGRTKTPLTFALIRPATESVLVTLAFTLIRLAAQPPSHQRATGRGQESAKAASPVAQAKAAGFGPVPKLHHSQDYRQEEAHRTTCNAARNLPSSSTGNWTGPRASKKARLMRQQLRRLRALLEDDWDLVEWDGRDPKLILDADGCIVAVLLGRPEGNNWEDVIAEMARAMDGVRACGVKRGVFKRQEHRHRRGDFYVLKGGLTKGPGQKKPGNLVLCKEYQRLLELIADHPAIRQIAGFQSSGLARYLPRLYRHYKSTMQSIFKHQPELTQLFPNSIFPRPPSTWAPTSSAGTSISNISKWCASEFPSGASVLLLSGPCHHGNTPIARRETRYSMTQYAAGALFRWVAYGHQTVQSLLAQKGGAAHKAEVDGELGARAEYVLGLLSKADELDADRKEVFG
ncbi:hypothetical protein B0H14DRAFT_3428403 [Mycena olivaceomarginata]|nr:hypothetical protein B0H14DRAFT_3428403 [Mycena olivaceomarginata]